MKKASKLGLVVFCGILMVSGIVAQTSADSQLMTEVEVPMTPVIVEAAAIGIVPVPANCDNQSHNACIGKADGAACDENGDGVDGSCVMIHPSSECICDEPAPPKCDDQSHNACIGKTDGAACDENGDGVNGTCGMRHPSNECICDEPAPVQQQEIK